METSKDTESSDSQVVTPWEVKSSDGIDYGKLIRQFGCDPITGDLIKRFEEVTRVKAHCFLRRGVFFSNKDLSKLLDSYEQGKSIYIYTGRGPSSESMHLGHTLPIMFTKFLQDAFQCFVVIQMSDDEKYHFKRKKEGHPLSHYNKLAYENAKDIIACGFDPDRTFIFSNLRATQGHLYENVVKIDSSVTGNKIRAIYGLDLDNSIGEISWPSKQCAPSYSASFADILHKDGKYDEPTPDGFRSYVGDQIMCLVPMAIDQDPYFRMARDFAETMKSHGYIKPATIHSKFIPSLAGLNDKMSSSTGSVMSIFLNMTPKEIQKTINRHAFSGGHETVEDHRKYGGDLTVDISYQYLAMLLEDDDKLKDIARQYSSGEMLSGEIKKIVIEVVTNIVTGIQERRALITDDLLRKFFDSKREFNFLREERPPIKLESDEAYANYGCAFDITFGYKCKLSPSELEKLRSGLSEKEDVKPDEIS